MNTQGDNQAQDGDPGHRVEQVQRMGGEVQMLSGFDLTSKDRLDKILQGQLIVNSEGYAQSC